MRPGAGKEKGSEFERETGRILSKWITKGERDDLFCRTVLSGGQYTVSGKGNPGDLMAQDPLVHKLCSNYMIECKHWANLDMFSFIRQQGELHKALVKLCFQAGSGGKSWLYVVKQNWYPTLVMTPIRAYHNVEWTSITFDSVGEFTIVELTKFLEGVNYERLSDLPLSS